MKEASVVRLHARIIFYENKIVNVTISELSESDRTIPGHFWIGSIQRKA